MTLKQSLLKLDFKSNLAKFRSNEIMIRVRMKGESPDAHADAILVYFGFGKSNEDTFKAKYGYDLRQSFIETYKSGDQLTAHKAVGGGYFEVTIPLSQTLVAQIKSIKNPISSNLSNGNSNVSEGELRRPTPVPKNAAPAVQNFYRELDLFKTETLNFGYRMVHTADVRADYLKTIKYASNEFVEMVESGQISYEEGALRANKLRNVIYEMSRLKDSELFRAYAQSIKPKARPFEYFLGRYSNKLFNKDFIS